MDVVIASSEADARAVEAVVEHHAALAGALGLRVATLLDAADRGDRTGGDAGRDDLVAWCGQELLPHALAEEQAMYPAAHGTTEGRLLVDGMLAEHQTLTALVEELRGTTSLVRAAAAARALQVLFESHLAKENEQVLPLLATTPGTSVAALLAGMHEVLGGGQQEEAHATAGTGHSCSCGEVDGPGYPELDARVIPHAIRHATIFGALDSVAPGSGLVLLAPHDPLPLLAQVERRSPGTFTTEYLERGPETWRISFARGA